MLEEMGSEENAGIIALTESHLNEEIRDAEISIKGYEAYRSDRVEYKNGGVIVYVRSDLNLGVRILLNLSCSKVEVLVLKLERVDTIFITLYRPPDTTVEVFHRVLVRVGEIIEVNGGHECPMMLTGDLNMPIVNWSTRQTSGGTHSLQVQVDELLRLTDKYYMDQYIDKPTRGANILDLFFANNEDHILKVEVQPPTLLSDHNLFIVTVNLSYTLDEVDTGNLSENEMLALNFNDNSIMWEEIQQMFFTLLEIPVHG